MRGEDEADDLGDAGVCQGVDGVLDARFGVAEPKVNDDVTGRFVLQFAGDHRPLGLCALDERADPADRFVAPGEVGELLGTRRPAAADVGVVGGDVLLARRGDP